MSTATATAYDCSGPPVGMTNAAKAGDLAALDLIADWYLERGQPADPTVFTNISDAEKAFSVSVLKAELENWHAAGRNLRLLLERFPLSFFRSMSWNGRITASNPLPAKRHEVAGLLVNCGLGARVTVQDRVRKNAPFIIECPTDHQNEAQTRDSLLDLLGAYFPKAKFNVEFRAWDPKFGYEPVITTGLFLAGLNPFMEDALEEDPPI